MKMFKIFLMVLGVCLAHQGAWAQAGLLNKIKQRTDAKADEALDNLFGGKKKANAGNNAGDNRGASSSGGSEGVVYGTKGGSRASNKGGEGLAATTPDVKQNLTDAEASYKAGSFGEARYAVQQAMLGVELEIGQKILASLPEAISGLKKDEEVEQVTSMGWGWAGLTILRQYTDSQEKEFRVTVANNAAYVNMLNNYIANGGYAQTTGGQQDWKQTKVKGHRAVIEYSDGDGYKLTVPLGQSSMLMYEGVNFKNEQEVMAAANAVDIDGIKKMLGEK
ncbi:hypothetical protein [Pontibacter beigongshangensis]|uniref:hypothetical protein n=1 Tax=Pontibacter beigongshangensis TaxID=2574733 RepID=UPI00164F5419|nr:hypothetical protein [Pontibacter beigongshangensis]